MRKDEFTKMKKDKAITSFLQWCIGDGFAGCIQIRLFSTSSSFKHFSFVFSKITMQDNQYTLLVLVCLSFFLSIQIAEFISSCYQKILIK